MRSAANFLSILAWALPLGAATNGFEIAPEPAWVLHTGSPSALARSNPDITEGEVYLLSDQQVNANTREYYGHFARQVVTDTGVQNNGRLEFSVEPTYEKLSLHFIHILRGTNRVDQLRREKINVLQQEKQLEAHIYDGRISAVLFLEDLRVGDIIDYAFTIRGTNPIWGDHFAEAYNMNWGRPLSLRRLRVLWPKTARPLFIRKFLTDAIPQQRKRTDFIEYDWLLKDTAAVLEDRNAPIWFNSYSFIQLSDFASWSEVANLLLPLYAPPASLPADLEQQIAAWRGNKSLEQQTQSALRFVQDEIRYTGIEIGPHSHKPERPATVFARRFGDCKDKALLLCAILRRLNVPAAPALVHTLRRHTIAEWHPTPFAFDHVIVRLNVNGKHYWLDPTRTHQRGSLDESYLPDYGRALLLEPGAQELTHIPFPGGGLPRMSTHETYTVSAYDKPARLRVTTIHEGAEADRIRSRLSDTRREELEKSYRDFYARTFPAVRTTFPLHVEDAASSNRVQVTEHYEIPNFWSRSENNRQFYCEFQPHSISELIESPGAASRTAPFAVSYPRRRTHAIEVHLPEPWPVEADTQRVDSPGFRFRFKADSQHRTVRLHYEIETLADAIPAARTQDHINAVDRANEFTTYMIYRANPAAAPGWDQMNWPMAFGVVMYLILAAGGGFMLYRRFALSAPDVPHPIPPFSLQPQLQGLSGWLILVGIGVVATPFRLLFTIYQNGSAYGLEQWQALTGPGSESYHQLWAPLLIFELIGNLTLLVGSVLVLILFFKKKRVFPKAFIVLLCASAAVVTLDLLAAYAIPAAREQIDSSSQREVTRSLFALVIWGSYMCKSKRVKATFIE